MRVRSMYAIQNNSSFLGLYESVNKYTSGLKWTQVDPSGPKNTKVDQIGLRWIQVDQGGPKGDPSGSKLTQVDPSGPKRTKVDPS